MTRKNITSEIEIWSRYARKLGTNNAGADAKIDLYIAPEVDGYDEYIYLETNGDPVLIGWLEGGNFVPDDDAMDWLDQEAWIADAIMTWLDGPAHGIGGTVGGYME